MNNEAINITPEQTFTHERETRDKEEPWPKRYRKRPQKNTNK